MAEQHDSPFEHLWEEQIDSFWAKEDVKEDIVEEHGYTNKDWEELQRDVSLYPEYTNYLYGPDTRTANELSADPASEYKPFHPNCLPKQLARQWIPPEEVGYIENHAKFAPDRPLYRFEPQAAVRPIDSSSPSNAAELPRSNALPLTPPLHMRTNSASQPLRDSRNMQQACYSSLSPYVQHSSTPLQVFRGPVSEHAHNPFPDPVTPTPKSEPVVPKAIKVEILKPGDIQQAKYDWMPQNERDLIDDNLKTAWTTLRASQFDEQNRTASLTFIQKMSRHIQDSHRKFIIRRQWLPMIWALMKVRQNNPSESSVNKSALRSLTSVNDNLTMDERQYCGDYISRMSQAEQEGRPPLSVLV